MNPFDQAWGLLKEDDFPKPPYEHVFNESAPVVHPGHISEIGLEGDSSLVDVANRKENDYREAYIDGRYDPGEDGPWWQGLPRRSKTLGRMEDDWADAGRHDLSVKDKVVNDYLAGNKNIPIHVNLARIQDDYGQSFYGMPFNNATNFTRSESTMNPFDQAWIVLKAPIYERIERSNDYEPYSDSLGPDDQFTMLHDLEGMRKPFLWQSKDGNSRGTFYPDDFHNSIKIDNFELNSNIKGQNKATEHLENFIDEVRDYAMERGYDLPGTHVTNVEHSAAGFWDKMVDRGVIDGAHPRNSIRINSAGDEHYTHAYDDKTQPWQHELNPEYAEYHNLGIGRLNDEPL